RKLWSVVNSPQPAPRKRAKQAATRRALSTVLFFSFVMVSALLSGFVDRRGFGWPLLGIELEREVVLRSVVLSQSPRERTLDAIARPPTGRYRRAGMGKWLTIRVDPVVVR